MADTVFLFRYQREGLHQARQSNHQHLLSGREEHHEDQLNRTLTLPYCQNQREYY